ncbi:hypothetical protein [Streptomyces sp. NPDC001070]
MQVALFEPEPPPLPDLADADLILANSSAGKDSQAMLHHVVQLADAAGVRDRVQVVHCDLGDVEWPGTRDLAAAQAAVTTSGHRLVSIIEDSFCRGACGNCQATAPSRPPRRLARRVHTRLLMLLDIAAR